MVLWRKYQFSQKFSEEKFLKKSLREIFAEFNNDLEQSAISKASEINTILQNLQKFSPICTKMSGSGSSCFAIFEDRIELENCFEFFTASSKNFSNFLYFTHYWKFFQNL